MEIENWYAAVDAEGWVVQFDSAMEAAEGPNLPMQGPFQYHKMAAMPSLPIQPTPTCRLRWMGYELDPEWVEVAPLDELKARKAAEITQQRLATDSDHFVYQGLSIRTADKDMFDMLIAHARIMMGDGMPHNWPGGWKAIENDYVLIRSIDEWRPFFIAMYDAGIANFNRSQYLKASINAATTPEQVAAIRWDMEQT